MPLVSFTKVATQGFYGSDIGVEASVCGYKMRELEGRLWDKMRQYK